MIKKIRCVAVILLSVCLFVTSCATPALQNDFETRVTKVEPSQTLISTNADIPVVTEEMVIGVTSLAFKGVVLNNKDEYLFEQKRSDTITLQDYKGVIEFQINEIIYSEHSDIKEGDKIRVLTNSCTHSFENESIALNVGAEYVILACDIAYIEDLSTFDFRQIADFCIRDQRTTVMNISDSNILFDPAYKSFSGNATKTKRIKSDNGETEGFSMEYNDLKDRLFALLNGKSKE